MTKHYMVSGVKNSLKEGRPKPLQKNSKQFISQSKKTRMADQAAMNDVIMKTVAEATRATIQTMVELHQGQEDQRPKVGCLVLKQLQFNWDTADKYTEWEAFVLEVRNGLSTYNAHEQEKFSMVKNWLGRKGLHYNKS